MKFEQLPNEILIECFEYLNALDLFYSFDQLNYRFHKLIRNISLHLNLYHINKSLFDQFFQEILLNPQIKSEIISLELSNKNTSGLLNVFLSFFSLNEFSHLRLLTLTDLYLHNFEQIKSILLLLFDFISVYFDNPMIQTCEMLSNLFPLKIQMTSMSNLYFNSTTIYKTMTITSLTISCCCLNKLWQLFKYAPMLKYLSIQKFSKSWCMNNELVLINVHVYAVYLKQLVINDCCTNFETFELLLKQTPNLEILTINIEYELNIINAERWKHLISSSLHHLDIFNFEFLVWFVDSYNSILNMFRQFQTYFWHEQHHWYTNYELYSDVVLIYTKPYMWNKYKLRSDAIISTDITMMNNSKIFNYVTDLSLSIEALNGKSEFYFQNVKSLTLINEPISFKKFIFNLQLKIEQKRLESLKIIVNLSNLEHLNTRCICNTISSTFLLEILKQAPQLSSLAIHKSILISFLTNDELCQYLNKMIKILDIACDDHDQLIDIIDYYSDEVSKLCKIFSNVEQLHCCINQTDVFLFILNHLPKLKNIKVKKFPSASSRNMKLTASKLNINAFFYNTV